MNYIALLDVLADLCCDLKGIGSSNIMQRLKLRRLPEVRQFRPFHPNSVLPRFVLNVRTGPKTFPLHSLTDINNIYPLININNIYALININNIYALITRELKTGSRQAD